MTEVLASQTHSTPATEMHWQGGGGCRVMVWENYPPPQRGQIIEKHHKSASTTPQRPIWNSFATVGVRDFWENGCKDGKLND